MSETLAPPITDQDLPPDPFAGHDPLLENLESQIALTTPEDRVGIVRTPEADPVTGAIETSEDQLAANALEDVVSFVERVYKNGAKHVYGEKDDGTKVHLSHADVMAAFGHARGYQGKPPDSKPKHLDTERSIEKDDALAVSLNELQQHKDLLLRMYGKDKYAERFANNPKVDPDAFIAQEEAAAKPGRHAVGETQATVPTTEPGPVSNYDQDANEPKKSKDDRVVPVKGIKGVSGHWWADFEPSDTVAAVARPQKRTTPLKKVSAGEKLHWQEEEALPQTAESHEELRVSRRKKIGRFVLRAFRSSNSEDNTANSQAATAKEAKLPKLNTPKTDALDLRRTSEEVAVSVAPVPQELSPLDRAAAEASMHWQEEDDLNVLNTKKKRR